jgi:ATP-binding cassette, subfamily B, bacterial MsbA
MALVAMIISGIASVLPSWLVKISVDGLSAIEHKIKSINILPQQSQNYLQAFMDTKFFEIPTSSLLVILPVSIIVVAFVEAGFKFLYQYYTRELGLLVVKDLKEKFHHHINQLSISRLKKYDSGSLVSVISSDLQSMQSWLAESLMNMFTEIFKAIFLFAWLLVLNWKLTIYAILTIPLFAIPVLRLGKSIRTYARKGQDYVGTISSFTAESLKNQSIIKSFNLEDWRDKKFSEESNQLYKLFHNWILRMALVSPLTNLIGAIGISVILFLGIQAVNLGELSIGEFSSFFVTSILLYDPVKRLGRVTTIVQSAMGVADRVFDVLDQKTQSEENPQKSITSLNQKISGDIVFENISFGFDDKKIFENLNLRVPAQTSLALIGPSGSGKSTLVSLIPRFYELDDGKILIDGIDTKSLSLCDLRRNIALVTQEPLLFTGSIKENIALGLSDKKLSKQETEELIEQAAKESFVFEFAKNLEKGLDSEVGEGGNKLSLGQRQRISIARAFISRAPIIIMDEPTSALDNESQEFIYKSIQKLMQSRTIIIIAHRLSTIKNCNQIIYLEDGKIIESGSHEELVQKGKAYVELLG